METLSSLFVPPLGRGMEIIMKFSKFTNIIKSDCYLLHNALYDSILKVNKSEYKKFIDENISKKIIDTNINKKFFEILQEMRFIIDEDIDEFAILNSKYFEFEYNSELHIMLIVTRRCNFRCAYCYEDFIESDMPEEVFYNAKDFIINSIKNNHYRNVYISFFGGEPTLMSNSIIKFMNSLQYENEKLIEPASIKGIVTTNGYLLKPSMIDAFTKCNIIRYQVTIDGLKETHDASRYLKNGDSTWNTIIDNLKYLSTLQNDEIKVLIRSNITPDIYKNIDNWLEYLSENFNKNKFAIHFEAAKNFGHMNDPKFELLDNETEIILDIIGKAKKWKLPLELISFRTTPFSLVCYAARYFSIIIDYNGEIKKCTSSSLDEPYNNVGLLHNRGFITYDKEKASNWTSYNLDSKCYQCPILPLCYMRKCPISKYSNSNCELLIKSYYKGLEYNYL